MRSNFKVGRETHNCPCDECNGSEYPHHELDEAHIKVGIETIVAAGEKEYRWSGQILGWQGKRRRKYPRNDCSIICMYNSWYHIEQTIAWKRSCSQVCLLLGHELASRRVNLGEVLADDEESSELGSTDGSIEYECSNECLLTVCRSSVWYRFVHHYLNCAQTIRARAVLIDWPE